MEKITFYESLSTDPYFNLSFEEYLFDNLEENEFIVFLWRNDKSVIIGSNQNSKTECDAEIMKKHNINMVRRKSGGGAVYQDLGNTNFTFISNDLSSDYVYECVSTVVEMLSGIKLLKSSRNDLIIEDDGRKVSGSAFRILKYKKMHHGTLLMNVDMDILSSVLTPNSEKLSKHTNSVKSVESRVANLHIEHEIFVKELFNIVSPDTPIIKIDPNIDLSYDKIKITTLVNKMKSDEWIHKISCLDEKISKRFDNGVFVVSHQNKKITGIDTDCLDVNIIDKIKNNDDEIKYILDWIKENELSY